MVDTKITLKVKSGPGDIIGITELDSLDGLIDFKGIQFSDPGEYVISVIPSNLDKVEKGEFSINIEKEEGVIPQEKDQEAEEKEINGTRPIITQIVQPTIELQPMVWEMDIKNDDNKKDILTSLGYVPLLWYNGSEISKNDIITFKLFNDGLVPKFEAKIKDTYGFLKNPNTMPLNNTKIEFFLNSGNSILKSIHLKFKLELNKENKDGTFRLTGTLDLDEFYKPKFKTYTETSFNVLKDISIEHKLGFNSNITNTQDSMTWRRTNLTSDFMKQVMKHSYISDDSFLLGYIDYYWCFNYVDVEKEWKRDISKDVGLISTGIASLKDPNKTTQLALTNDMSNNTSPFFFNNIKLKNNSTKITTKLGTKTLTNAYDRQNKSIQTYDIYPNRTDGDNNIVLSGAPGEKEDTDNYSSNFRGKIDTDNVHENYLYALDQNSRNLINLMNITMNITLPTPNFNLYRYQKIQVNYINQKQTVLDENLINERLTGEWIIMNIIFDWRKGNLVQKLLLARKELGKTTHEKKSQKEVDDNSGNNELNDNPSDDIETVEIPNTEYKENEIYTVEDKDGKKYKVIVMSILENGDEIAANITEIIE